MVESNKCIKVDTVDYRVATFYYVGSIIELGFAIESLKCFIIDRK